MEILNNNQISTTKCFLRSDKFFLSIRAKVKADENNNNQSPTTTSENKSTDDGQQIPFEFGKTPMRSSTMHTFALGYLESLIQIRVCLISKQKTLRSRQTSA